MPNETAPPSPPPVDPSPAERAPLPLEELVRLPSPGLGGPHAFRFAGDRLFWLASGADSVVQVLWSLDLADPASVPVVAAAPPTAVSEEGLPLEERLRRERLRERALGITSYRYAGKGKVLLAKIGGDLWVDPGDGLRVFPGDGGQVLDAAPAPDGTRIAFVRDAELCVAPIGGGPVTELTSGARGTGRTHGLAEFVAQEEMHRRNGFWWSPDSAWLAYAEVDDTHVPVWRIPHEGSASPSWEDHRYPFAGAANATVRLWVVPSAGGAPVRMQLEAAGTWEYLARVGWLADGALIAQVQDRRQRTLTVVRLDPATGAGEVVLVEHGAPFVEIDDLFWPLDRAPGAFLWGSDRSGFRHLHHVDRDGKITALTAGDGSVCDLVGVDEGRGLAYVVASADGPLDRHLYAVRLAPEAQPPPPPIRLTVEPGIHTPTLDTRGQRFVDGWNALDTPPRVVLRSLADGAALRPLYEANDPRIASLALRPPELTTVTGPSGDTLHVGVYRPDGPGPHPTVVFVYGGPGDQRVINNWLMTIDMRAQHLRSVGVAVVKIDNRGSNGRGKAFTAALYGETGKVEVEDQVAAVRALGARGIVDLDHVGISGWSYGGYMVLMAMAKAPDLFRVGVAGAPVTHWDTYDTHYTERYMGLPAENADGYARSSVLGRAADIAGRLMIVHGMIDENVHFRHTARLVNALVAARKDFELQLFPDERHLPRRPADRLYMEQRIIGFLRRHL